MTSPKSKLEKFLKGNPEYKDFFDEIIEKEKEAIHKDVDHELKEKLIQKSKAFVDYDVENFKKPSCCDFKYKLELLENSDNDFQVLEKALKPKETECLLHNHADKTKSLHSKVETKKLNVYRVIPTELKAKESGSSCFSKLLLLHGTKARNVEGILKTGFEPSQNGKYGPGVYLTDSIDCAYEYGKSIVRENGLVKMCRYIFVNQTRQAYEEKCPKTQLTYEQYLCKEPCLRFFTGSFFEEPASDAFDSENRKILQGSFQKEKEMIATAHHSLVVPAYLIEIEEKLSVKEIVHTVHHDILKAYADLNSSGNSKISGFKTSFLKYIYADPFSAFNYLKEKENTLDIVTKELEREFVAEGYNNVKFHKSKIDKYISEVVEQLSFSISSLAEAKDNLKYKTDILTDGGDDYDFVLRLLKKSENSNGSYKVSSVFKVSPKDEKDLAELKGEYLFYSGAKSNKIRGILSDGYVQCKNAHSDMVKQLVKNGRLEENDICNATLDLEEEISKSSSYYAVNGRVKKLSFVFVSTAEGVSKGPLHDAKVVKDSRGSCFDANLAARVRRYKSCQTPAYLVVFELDEQDC